MTDDNARETAQFEGEGPASTGDTIGRKGPEEQIGPYKLISILGEGGCGIVYLADQHEPVRRRVAIKVIKPGMDSRRVVARFEAERQALALLEHPNIASVYEAGTTGAGRPYFAMEYVKGLSIIQHCDRHRLAVDERLGLFLQICEAVQHAHQKGIIHRDIKPSNVLVAVDGNRATPKVIDFGIAKAVHQPLTTRTLQTEQGQLIGTLEYMSPEQVGMGGQDVDTRSDVYSLGVLLYELLTGVLPFESGTLRQGGPDRLREVICEQDPQTPSTRLSGLEHAESARIAQQRRVDPGTLRRKLRGDLDWITVRAMEKDRARRYSSPGELAADIRRHLTDEPVAAGPPSTLYRLRKGLRRHQALVTGLAAVLIVLLAGIAGVVAFAIKAEQQAREADRQARAAEAVADFLNADLLGAVAPERAKSPQVTVRSILDAAAARLEGKFAEEPLVEASIRQTLGETYIELGDYRSAEPHLKRAYDLRRGQLGDSAPLTLTSMSQLGRVYLLQARYKEAEPLLVEALEAKRRLLGPDHVDTLESSVWLGEVYAQLGGAGRLERADKLLAAAFESASRTLGRKHPITLEAMAGLAYVHGGIWGRTDEAASLSLEGYETARNVLGEEHWLTLRLMTQSAWYLAWQGREEGQARATAALEACQRVLGREHPQTLDAMSAFGIVYAHRNEFDKAESLLTESLSPLRRILGDGHGATLFATRWLAHVRMFQGRYQEAGQLLTKMVEDGRQSFGDDGGLVMVGRLAMIDLYAVQEQPDELKAWCSAEIERLRSTSGPKGAAYVLNGLAWMQAGYMSPVVRNASEAIKHATEACELTAWKTSTCIDTLAAAHAEAGDFAGAVRWQKRAIEVLAQEPPPAMDRAVADSHLQLYESGRPIRFCVVLGQREDPRVLLRRMEYEKAEREWTKALAVVRRHLGDSHPETLGCVLAISELYEAWGKPEEAEKWRAQLPPQAPASNQ